MRAVLFFSGLGTNEDYFKKLVHHLNMFSSTQIDTYFYQLSNHDSVEREVRELIDLLKSKYSEVLLCAFSMSCYFVADIANDLPLVLIDPPTTQPGNNPLIKTVMTATPMVMWIWDHVLPRILKYHILAGLDGYKTPPQVDYAIACMSITKIKDMVKRFLLPYKDNLSQSNKRIYILIGTKSKYKLEMYPQHAILIHVNADHHMIYRQPSKISEIILSVWSST